MVPKIELMTFTTKTYEQNSIHAQISSFEGKGGVTEYHIMFSVASPSLPFCEQLDRLQAAYETLTKQDLKNAVAVFRRYFLSDAANQAESLIERECEIPYCALSVVQQAPMNGTKIALWVWLQTDMTTETYKSGMFEAAHNGYRHFERMMENISALLQEGGASIDDIMQAIVYLRDPADYVEVDRYIRSNYPHLPHLIVLAPVCRPGWLIETECIAIIPADLPQYPCL